MLKVSSKWKKHLKETEVEEFKGLLLSADRVLEVLGKVLKDDLIESNNRMRDRRKYGSSNWSHSMADEIGTQRTLESIIKLIELDKSQEK